MSGVTRRTLLASMLSVAAACGIKLTEPDVIDVDPTKTACFVLYVHPAVPQVYRDEFVDQWQALMKGTPAEKIPMVVLDKGVAELGILGKDIQKV